MGGVEDSDVDAKRSQAKIESPTTLAREGDLVSVTPHAVISLDDAARIGEIRWFLEEAFSSAPGAVVAPSSSLPVEATARIPSQLEVAVHQYKAFFFRLIPLSKQREEAVREKIRWAIRVDDRHRGLRFPKLEQKLIALTDESRGFVDQVVRERLEGLPSEIGTRDTLMVLGKDDTHEEVFVVVQRIREDQGPSYVVYEVARNKTTKEMVILSHAGIDTDTNDKSKLESRLRTSCSWKKEGFDSDKHPRAAAIIFNALILNVLKPIYLKDATRVFVDRKAPSEPKA